MARFERLQVWQRALDLGIAIEEIAVKLRYEAASQLRRSAASIADNIAEGAERGTAADYARFLDIAAGSCAETQSQLRFAQRSGIEARGHIHEAQQIGWMIAALKRALAASPAPG